MALPENLEPTAAWKAIREELRRKLGESTYDIWIAPLEVNRNDRRAVRGVLGPDRALIDDLVGLQSRVLGHRSDNLHALVVGGALHQIGQLGRVEPA